MEIIDWINTNDGVIIAVATIVLVFITGYYAYLTWRMLKANNTPEIAISLRPHEAHVNALMFCIENIGTGAAHNLQFTINPPSVPNLDIPFEKIRFLQNGITFFEPGRKIEQLLVIVRGKDKLNKLRQTPLKITVNYRDTVNRKQERAFCLDFGEYEGFSQFGTPPLHAIAKDLKKIQDDLHHITSGSRKPIILTEPLSEHRVRQRANALECRIEQLPKEVQEEILQEFDVAVTKREKEAQEKDQNLEITSDENSL